MMSFCFVHFRAFPPSLTVQTTTTITTFQLHRWRSSADDLKPFAALADALKVNTSLTNLFLDKCRDMGEAACRQLGEVLKVH